MEGSRSIRPLPVKSQSGDISGYDSKILEICSPPNSDFWAFPLIFEYEIPVFLQKSVFEID